MINYKIIVARILTFLVFILTSSIVTFAQPSFNNNFTSVDKTVNFNDLDNWAAHPWKKDLSDSIPGSLLKDYEKDSLVDVFFIHPTTYTDEVFNGWNADIADENLNKKTDNSTILYQASVFNEKCRVFAPRYRQAHINSFYIDSKISKPYFDIAYDDIKIAFEYYLKNYNNGRPIIIASHSQGTKHAGRLLKEFFENKPLYKKLVCAYIIGMPVPENYFNNIPVCSSPDQTGCFVSWRTYKNGYEPQFLKNENFKSIVVNPLTWNTDETYAEKNLNKGAVMKNFNQIVPAVVDAQIHGNILWSCKPDVFGKIFFTKKNFHIGDINLFYVNIRENVRLRIKNYFEQNN
jgi:hypothetical protein